MYIMSYVEQTLQWPFSIFLLLGSVILTDVSRATGLFKISKRDRRTAEALKSKSRNMKRIVFHDAVNAVLTEVCMIAILCCLMQDGANKLLIVAVGIMGLILTHFMISLYSMVAFALEDEDEQLNE